MQTCFLLRPAGASFSSFWNSAPPGKIKRDGICKLLRRPGIDSKESIPPVYLAWARICKLLWSTGIETQEFLGSLQGLQIWALTGWYDIPIPTRFLAPINWSKIPGMYARLIIHCVVLFCLNAVIFFWLNWIWIFI